MNDFRIEMRRSMYGVNGHVYLQRRINLPFIPHPGMTITNDDWSFTVDKVEWNCQSGFCYVVEKSYFDKRYTIEKLIEEFDLKRTWEKMAIKLNR